jgi:hypothetical protein
VLLKPTVLVARVHEKCDASRKLIDGDTQRFLRELLQALYDGTLRLRGEAPFFACDERGE